MDLRIPQGGIQVEECFICDLASLYDAITTQLKEPRRDVSLLQERQGGIQVEECFCCDLSHFEAIATQPKEHCRDESLLQERQGGIQVEECFCCDLSHFDAIATQPKVSCREEPLLRACRDESLLQERQSDLQQIARVSSFVVSTILFLGVFFGVWRQLSIIQVQPLHKEHGPLSIWLPFLMLLGFMAFICAIAVLNSVRAPVTRMQKTMVILWVILMILY